MSTARRGLGGAGVASSALAFAGFAPPDTAASEEFTGETVAARPAQSLTTST